ncbi:LysR family transcriptional regulator [Parvularcula mediterranea]|nr:LysR family transcriptional regulator [Parvularcula mediterranea]
MDVTQARTFLAIVEGGNFVAASKRLFVTQSTVSARIKALEEQLGKPLFTRSKAGTALTPAGHQFYRFARSFVRVWEEARHQVAVPEAFDDTLAVGGQVSLWNRLLTRWVPVFQERRPRVALRCMSGMPQRLMREMSEGTLDLAILYRPEHRPGMAVEELIEDQLILVTAAPDRPLTESYIYCEWGTGFGEWHAAQFPELHNPGLAIDLGAIGVNLVINQKGAAYLPRRIVEPHLEEGLLTGIEDAPAFPYPAYAVWQEEFVDHGVMEDALATLRETAEASMRGELPPPYWA